MLQMRKDHWAGNTWASIDITPNNAAFFLPILTYLSRCYGFPFPRIIDLIDGYAADFALFGSAATIDTDTFAFSIAFADQSVRDRVFDQLQALPDDYFELTS